MFAAPILAFVTTHILYLNFYELDYGKVTLTISHYISIANFASHIQLLILHLTYMSIAHIAQIYLPLLTMCSVLHNHIYLLYVQLYIC